MRVWAIFVVCNADCLFFRVESTLDPRLHMTFSSPRLLTWALMLSVVFVQGCKGPASLADLPPYPEDYQRAWFAAMQNLGKGDLEQAREGFVACLGMAPDEPSVRFQLGKIDLELGKPADARVHFDAALDLLPEDLWIREFRGRAALEAGDPSTALADARIVVEERAGDLERAFGWIDLFLQSRSIEAALTLCDLYEEVSGPDVDIAVQRLMVLEWLEDDERFEEALAQAIGDHPDEPEFRLQEAHVLESKGDIEGATAILESLHTADPSDGWVALELARMLTAMADASTDSKAMTDRAMDLLRIAMGSGEVTAAEKLDVLVGYLMLASMTDAWHEVTAELIGIASDAHPDEVKFAQMRADLCYERGDLSGTLRALEQALSIDPGNREVWRDALALHAELEQWPEMSARGMQAVERFPVDAELHLLAAMGASQTKALDQALQLLRRGAPLAAANPLLKARFKSSEGDVLHDLGDDVAAAAAYEASLALQPDDPFVLNNHAYYLALRGADLERALDCSRRANSLMPGTASFLDTEAWVLHVMGQHAEALARIEAAMAAGAAGDPEVLEHKGDILRALGRQDEAAEVYRKAIESGADAEEMLQKIDPRP